jgi:predicted dehydrogenase
MCCWPMASINSVVRSREGESSARPLRVLLVGGNWGLIHLAAWRAVAGVEVIGICTAHQDTAEKAAAKHGLSKAFWHSNSAIVDPDVDFVDLSVRPTIREPLAFAALRAGKHVLQTLPFALSLATGTRLRAAAEASGCVAMIESLHRHSPVFRQFRDLVQSGAIGKVHSVKSHVRTGILLSPPAGWPYRWIVQRGSGASALRNFGAHLLHTLLWIFGPIHSVVAELATNHPELRLADGSVFPNETKDSGALLLRFLGGETATLDVSWCTPSGEGFLIDAVGDRGRACIVTDHLGPDNTRILRCGSDPNDVLEPVNLDPKYTAELEAAGIDTHEAGSRVVALAAMCRRAAIAASGGEADARPDFDEALHVMQVIEAAYRAHAERRWVSVEELKSAS